MGDLLHDKLKTLPKSPGVYFHRSKEGEIIYVGKAAVLKNRVRQYFQSKKDFDAKTLALVSEIHDTDWVETESEIDALFLESEMVKRYKPRYNILLRDDKSQVFVRVDMKNEWPYISYTRAPADDRATYIGPFYNGFAVKKALRYLRKVFPYYTKAPSGGRPDLDVHLGLSPTLDMTSHEYKKSLKKLIKYIEGGRAVITNELEKDMKRAARQEQFEVAADLRNKLGYLKELQRRIVFGDKEFLDISKDHALSDLSELLSLPAQPRRIEGYDVSHLSGTNVVASMVVFTNGVSDRSQYRKFKTHKEHNNDFYNMHETIVRRFREKNVRSWGLPDLLLIDGGKGQLEAAIRARNEANLSMPIIGLAKRQEQIVIHHTGSSVTLSMKKLTALEGHYMVGEEYTLLNLPHSTHIIKFLQRIRDESHRFAVSYHTSLRRAGQYKSTLEDAQGIGPATRKKLVREFGSIRGVRSATKDQLAKSIGPQKAAKLYAQLHDAV
ncbi:excinuclease ABC subunit UvrC [Candidatus Saccharibacteria bacterium]|nr:excinuclease ABC subunit UvrC [Candidatus Saccharibacteria bacterium]